MTDSEYINGYMDGGDPDTPEPNDNRSLRYRHGFNVRRAEMAGTPIPAQQSRNRVEEIEEEESKRYGS